MKKWYDDRNQTRYVFVGDSGCGKDTACVYLRDNYDLVFAHSMSWYLAPYVAEKHNIPVDALRGPDRHKYAKEMFEVGEEIRNGDPGKLVAEVLGDNELACGIRDPDEAVLLKGYKATVVLVWIDRDVPEDPTMVRFRERTDGRPWKLCDFRVDNTGTLDEFKGRLDRLMQVLG